VPRAPRLAWVGRVCEEKGVPILIEAAAELAREGRKFELVLLGDGPLLGTVRAAIAAQGLGERVRALGWASSEAVRAELLASRVLVQPSFAEGLPVVIMEALALGRPVISTQIAGIPELVDNSHTGWLVPAGSVPALTRALREALDAEPAELERLGREGRRRVLERHHIEREVERLEALIQGSAPLSIEAPLAPTAAFRRAA
jgi:glycosyltransferase involved in cell wall biosynthesis